MSAKRHQTADDEVLDSVKEYYGKVLNSSKDLKTSACTASAKPSNRILQVMKLVPKPVMDKFYGCGTPLPSAGLEGLHVLDLGCGSGRDCYLAAALVGEGGRVTGVDMTEEQLSVAKQHTNEYCEQTLKYTKTNMEFFQGYIERLDKVVAAESVDLVISNCVINLSPDKPSVLRGMFNVLRYGGEAYFSDVYCDRRLPQQVREHKVLWGECISGALYIQDFLRIAAQVGFLDARVMERTEITVRDAELKQVVGNAKFYSITYRLFKLKGIETLCEDYGQVATYLGTLEDKHTYKLDDHHTFQTGKPMLVCGNTAAMVGDSWLSKHFKVQGNRTTHFGLFDCAPSPAAAPPPSGTSCC